MPTTAAATSAARGLRDRIAVLVNAWPFEVPDTKTWHRDLPKHITTDLAAAGIPTAVDKT
jgi:hypothetical protein